MRQLPVIAILLGSLTASIVAAAPIPDLDAPIEVGRAWFHTTMFSNRYVTMVRVHIPAGSVSDYHIHKHDLFNVTISDYPPEAYTQLRDAPPNVPRKSARGDVSYATYFGKPVSHRAVNPGSIDVDILATSFNSPHPYGFRPGTRSVAGYTQVLDNNRVRAWRLVLQPGETAPAINQTAPGLRIVVYGGRISEMAPGRRERQIVLDKGEYYWQQAGDLRAVRNIGNTRIELVEIELK